MTSSAPAQPSRRPVPPSGAQLELTRGDQRAVVTEVGATVRVYEVGGRPVLEPFDEDEPAPGGHGQVLMPWPNRVDGGHWSWGGRDLALAHTEPSAGNAIHGLVRWVPWRVTRQDEAAVELEVLLGAQPGWPFPLVCAARYELAQDGLHVALSATNVGTAACPWGAGSHPYLATPGGVDTARVTLSAATWLDRDERGIPTDRRPVAGSPYELNGRPVGERLLDTAYTDLARTADGGVQVLLETADGWRTTLRGDSSVRWLQAFTGDTLPERYHRTALAVEPMTCPPDALRSGIDLVTIEPGATARLGWSVHATR